jgi:hypothetical protein
MACSFFVLGQLALFRGDAAGARAHCRQGLLIWWDHGARPELPSYLEALAQAAGLQGEPERAARLWGAVEALRESIGVPCPPVDLSRCQDSIAAARAALGSEAFAAAWADGRSMTLNEAIAEALHWVRASVTTFRTQAASASLSGGCTGAE